MSGAGFDVSLVIAGAVLGVLGVLATLIGLVNSLDKRYVTRPEFQAMMTQLTEIKTKISEHMERGR